ncbi:hypothetical protein G6F46_011684 [Rhizopus delemar]|uniref:Voltage-dependent ion-selective channel n=2 Tax=Rhizopus TaxID=4842 RepID=A0A9P6YTG9_9FUNG|nr:hypothetical protein G6F55_009956 [Rhizopus delemar]KAG1536724.1 hypothetical protein G6F51_010803 [Rhizopus arrhizus]KAG1492344.1 hypothetical protein G6F54_009379 [Rhizopus delemar]KAG1499240.1 hypothetical protein G6F53_011561 [Rhizopus delemar]KAG1514202.1 hypothetical protein G6F52_009978 [Rhizopus delemar]
MSIPVAFNDIGKPSKDLLSKDYPIDGIKVEVKTSAFDGTTFKVNGHRDNKLGIIAGDIETKYVDKQNGIVLTQAWTTSNILNGKIELENNLAKGLKLELLTSYLPITHGKTIKINTIHKQPNVHSTASVDLSKLVFSANSVYGQEGFLIGAEVAYNTKLAKVSNYNAAIGYSARQYAVALHATNSLSRYTASYYQRLDESLEATAKADWDKKTNTIGLEAGAKMVLDSTSFVKGKVTNTGIVGISYTQLIRPGIKANLGFAADSAHLNENAYKVGLTLTFEN